MQQPTSFSHATAKDRIDGTDANGCTSQQDSGLEGVTKSSGPLVDYPTIGLARISLESQIKEEEVEESRDEDSVSKSRGARQQQTSNHFLQHP